MKNRISITELSNLTNKTRPTIYKYISLYDSGNFNELPYNFKLLFDMIEDDDVTRNDIKNFCDEHFIFSNNQDLYSLVNELKTHEVELNIEKLLEDIKNGNYDK